MELSELREALVSFAMVREESELGKRKNGRTHYRAVLSFERKMETLRAARLVKEWLEVAFPEARAAAFVHQNTEHTHAHVWLDARKPDGRKLHLGRSEYRRLDELWNRIYSRELGRDEREHLDKKQARQEMRQQERSGERGKDTETTRAAGRAEPVMRSGRATPGERSLEAVADADNRAVQAAAELHRIAASLDRDPEHTHTREDKSR